MDITMLAMTVALAPRMVLAAGESAGATITTFLSLASEVVTWMITTFGSFLTFMLSNPICFIWLVISIIGACLVFLRKTIGG